MTAKIELPRCVFCGEDTELQGSTVYKSRYIWCASCEGCGPSCDTDLEAVTRYKFGASPERIPKKKERKEN